MRTRMTSSVALALAGALITPAQAPPPAFSTSTNLVDFSIVVQDRDGKPITDLKKEEVSVFDNDQPRQLAVFRLNTVTQTTNHPPALPPGVFSSRSTAASAGSTNFVAIVFDAVNTPLTDNRKSQAAMYNQMREYFTKLPPNTRAATYRVKNDVVMLHSFTDDFEALRATMVKTDTNPLPRFVKDEPGDPGDMRPPPLPIRPELEVMNARARAIQNEGIRDDKLTRTLAGLEAIGNQLAGLPGRKSLVWASSGMPIESKDLGFDMAGVQMVVGKMGGVSKSHRNAIERTARRLATQGVAIYSVWDEGPATDLLSSITGGRTILAQNDPAQGIAIAAADQSDAYSLGFYTGEPDAKWHPLKVTVSRPGAKVLYQQGYMSPQPLAGPQEWSDAQWRIAATSPLGSSEIRFDANARLVSGALQATLLIAAADLHFRDGASEFDIAITETTSGVVTNLNHSQGSVKLPESALGKGARVSFAKRWDINPKSTDIRLIVHDRLTGAYGSVDIPVKQIPQ